LICESYDDKGNAIVYRYVSEDDRQVPTDSTSERNRLGDHRKVNRYPKSILYGNLKPYLPTLAVDGDNWKGPDSVSDQSWMFEVVFDYGDHHQLIPTPVPDTPWGIRADPFSSHRCGFEIRTYRLCKRILMFHHFAGIARVGKDCLVRSTDFDYGEADELADPEKPSYTVLRSVTHRAYQRKAQVADGFDWFKRLRQNSSRTYLWEHRDQAISGLTLTAKVSQACSPSRPARGTTSPTSAMAGSVRCAWLHESRRWLHSHPDASS
jgi:hypothetical protein